jgi:hypothetical protein
MEKIKIFLSDSISYIILVIFLFLSMILGSIYEDFDTIVSPLKWALVFVWVIFLILTLCVAFATTKEKNN